MKSPKDLRKYCRGDRARRKRKTHWDEKLEEIRKERNHQALLVLFFGIVTVFFILSPYSKPVSFAIFEALGIQRGN